jgi:hypothetical protein
VHIPEPDQDYDPATLALDALDSAEQFRRAMTGVDRPVAAVVHALGGVTYALLAVAVEIRNLGEKQWTPTTRRPKSSKP